MINPSESNQNDPNYDKIISALKLACCDRVAKVQLAANEALKEWLKVADKNIKCLEPNNNLNKFNKLNLLRNLSKLNKDRSNKMSPKM